MLAGLAVAAALLPLQPQDLKPVRSWEVLGTTPGGYLGSPVCFLGDVDGDGITDLLAGAVEEETRPELNAEGFVRCLSGSDGRVLYRLEGGRANLRFGGELLALADLNTDGVADFAASTADGIDLRSGRDGKLLRQLVPREPKPLLRWSMIDVPDMDGDDQRDILVAIGHEPEMCGYIHDYDPAALILLSTHDGSQIRSIAAPEEPDLLFGHRPAVLGDRNGDGVPELAIDIPSDRSFRIHSGATGALLETLRQPEHALVGPLLELGDANGDGKADFVTCARALKPPPRKNDPWEGLELLSGRDGTCLARQALKGNFVFGFPAVSSLPDLDGDGVRDLAVGETEHGAYRGRVLILSGVKLEILGELLGPRPGSIFGCALDAIAELGDGRGPAVVVGAVGDDRRADYGGCVSLWRLQPP